MKKNLQNLLDNNAKWAESCSINHPGLFETLALEQTPHYLWIGCSDSRVPAETLLGLLPGEIFVHRNVGNLVHELDINTQSVLEFAVSSLKVSDIIVCGHTDCGAIKAATSQENLGIMNHWLAEVKDIYNNNEDEFTNEMSYADLYKLAKLNIIKQVQNVCKSAPVQRAWENNQPLSVHGLLNVVADGRLHDLEVTTNSNQSLKEIYKLKFSL